MIYSGATALHEKHSALPNTPNLNLQFACIRSSWHSIRLFCIAPFCSRYFVNLSDLIILKKTLYSQVPDPAESFRN